MIQDATEEFRKKYAPITVQGLIDYLQTVEDKSLLVIYSLHSEYTCLSAGETSIVDKGLKRVDDWVPDARPDQPTQKYFLIHD